MIYDKYKANLVLDWDLQKGSLSDQSASGFDATVGGNPYFYNSEKGRAMDFDGAGDYLKTGNVAVMSAQTTVSIWVKISGTPAGYLFVGRNGDPYFSGYISGTGLQIQCLPGSLNDFKATYTFGDNTWHHIVAIRNGDDRANLKIYIDGVNKSGAGAGNIGAGIGINALFSNGTSDYLKGKTTGMKVWNTVLSAEDVAKLYEEESTRQPYNVTDFKSKDRYINACIDWDMNKSGTNDWEADNSVLSKVSDSEKGQVFAVENTDGTTAYGQQYNLGAGWYRLRFWSKVSGAGVISRVKVGGTWQTGSQTSTDWVYFEEVLYNASAASVPLKLGSIGGAGTAYFKDVEVIRLGSESENNFVSPSSYIADGKGWNESLGLENSGFLGNTGFNINSGNWQVDDSSSGKQISCVLDGLLSRHSSQTFGTWEFDMYHAAATNTRIYLLASAEWLYSVPGQSGYMFTVGSTERLSIHRSNGDGSTTTLLSTVIDYVAADAWTRYRITRAANGEFTAYFSLDDGLTWTTVVADSGSNPVTDVTYTTSSYCVPNLGTGGAIRNFKFIPYIQ